MKLNRKKKLPNIILNNGNNANKATKIIRETFPNGPFPLLISCSSSFFSKNYLCISLTSLSEGNLDKKAEKNPPATIIKIIASADSNKRKTAVLPNIIMINSGSLE